MGMVPFMFFVALTHVSTRVIPFCDSRCIHREGLCLDIGTAVLFVYLILNRCFVSHLHKPLSLCLASSCALCLDISSSSGQESVHTFQNSQLTFC